MLTDRDQQRKTLENVVARQKQEASFVVAIQQICETNLARNRLTTWLQGDANRTIEQYVDMIVENYQQVHPYLNLLQEEGDDQSWQELWEKINQWIYNYLLKKGFRRSTETADLAEVYAQEASQALFTSYFPYDVAFERWAYILVLNTCRRLIRDTQRQKRKVEISPISLEEYMGGNDDLSPVVDLIHGDLQATIDRLESPVAQHVIRRHYFEDAALSTIAVELGKSPGAVYSIHFRALKSLQKLLQEYSLT